ncbi:hypothetical protein IFR04_013885, partial [Cadophora malorum]
MKIIKTDHDPESTKAEREASLVEYLQSLQIEAKSPMVQVIQVRADSDAQKPDSSRYCNRLHPDPFNGSTFPSALSDF